MPHCPSCTCVPAPLPGTPGETVRTLVGEGVSTVPELARRLAGGREPGSADFEYVRRIVEREVRAERLVRTGGRSIPVDWAQRFASTGDGQPERRRGAPPVRYTLP